MLVILRCRRGGIEIPPILNCYNTFHCFFFSYEELEQIQNYSGSVKYEGYKHQPNGEICFFVLSI